MRLMRDLVGETFSHRYRLVARVAGGGMGDVYRAHDLLLDRAVAVKVLQPGLASDPDLVARFKAEARAAARLTHPNVVAVYDWGEESDRTYYMVMEFVPGTDLRDVLVRRLFVVALAIAVLALASQAVGTFLEPRSVKVPSLVGMSKQRALNRAGSLELKVDVVDRQHHPDIKRGGVVSQDPSNGVLKEGMTIKVVLSSGPPRWQVPNVVGATLEAATVKLKASRFEVGEVERAYSIEPAGVVIEQSGADEKLPIGTAISLVVSKGPQTLSVPDVAGATPSEAKKTLESAGFVVDLTTDYSETVEEGIVIGTAPAAGSASTEGSTIQVIVSAGPRFDEVTMPDVRNMSLDSAEAQLQGIGLRTKVVEVCPGGTTVQETDPIAGTRMRENDQVALFVC
jgi:beta-lactam-binding protein with PASTA domain